MTRAEYIAHLAALSDADLVREAAKHIDAFRYLDSREQSRQENKGAYGLCWDACIARGKQELWMQALECVRTDIRERARRNAEALARIGRADRGDVAAGLAQSGSLPASDARPGSAGGSAGER